MRIAYHKYPDLPRLERRVHHLLQQNVLMYASKEGESEEMPNKLEDPDIQEVLQNFAGPLKTMFEYMSTSTSSMETATPMTISPRAFLALLSQTGIIGDQLTMGTALRVLVASAYHDEDATEYVVAPYDRCL